MAAPEDAQLQVIHGSRRIAGPRGGLGTGTVSKRICRTGVRPKHLSAAGSSICFSIGREFASMAVRTAITSRWACWAGRRPARVRRRHHRVLFHNPITGQDDAGRRARRAAHSEIGTCRISKRYEPHATIRQSTGRRASRTCFMRRALFWCIGCICRKITGPASRVS